MKYKWPTLEGRLNQPIVSRGEALRQLKACGGVTLTPWAEKELQKYEESKMKTAFISGHLTLTKEEFQTHYVPLIDKAIADGDHFVVGDARGTDFMAQAYLCEKLGEKNPRVRVFHMFEKPRNHAGNFDLEGGFKSDELRDSAMTVYSDYDIAWVREGRSQSGTAKNIARRQNLQSR